MVSRFVIRKCHLYLQNHCFFFIVPTNLIKMLFVFSSLGLNKYHCLSNLENSKVLHIIYLSSPLH